MASISQSAPFLRPFLRMPGSRSLSGNARGFDSGRMLTIPTLITLSRLVALPPLVGAFYLLPPVFCSAFFCLSAGTDWLDGVVARALREESAFGAWLDPVVDKIVVCSSLCLLVEKFSSPLLTLPTAVIVGRELGVCGLRELFLLPPSAPGTPSMSADGRMHVTRLAKWKTTLQLLSVCLLFYVDPPPPTSGWVLTPRVFAKPVAAKPESQMTSGAGFAKQDTCCQDRWCDRFADRLREEVVPKWLRSDSGTLLVVGLCTLWAAAGLSAVTGAQYARTAVVRARLLKKG